VLKRLALLLGLMLLASPLLASTHAAATCSQSDVQAKMTEATESGALVTIPTTGSPCHWTTNVSWSSPANATLQCLSTINWSFSHLDYSSPPNDGSVTIIDDRVDSHDILSIGSVTGTFRMYGCTFEKGTGSVKDSFALLSISGATSGFRFDHNRINLTTGTPVGDNGAKFLCVTGVADHNQVDLYGPGTGNGIKVGGCAEGDAAWAAATNYGAAGGTEWLYFEDNYYPVVGFSGNGHSNPVTGDCDHGGKQVLRENVIGTTATTGGGAGTQTHPSGGSGPEARGCRATEYYLNTLLGNATHSQTNAIFLSSGGLLGWGNSVATGYENFMTLHSMRKDNFTYGESATPSGWGYCGPSPISGTVNTSGTTVTGTGFNVSWPVGAGNDTTMMIIAGTSYRIASVDSTTQITLASSAGTQTGAAYVMGSAWDENNTTTSGKRCLDQPGNGAGDLLTGTPPSKVNSRTGTIAWPAQTLEPVLLWKNTPYSCAGCDHQFFISVYEPSVLAINVNYYLHVNADNVSGVQTSTTSPFNGSAGTGFGTHANRPASCTTGTAYFETDTGASWLNGTQGGQLFVCVANAWPGTPYYTPYTYPHPLVSGSSDTTVPTAGASGAITFASVTSSSITVNWTKGTDDTSAQGALQYEVCRSASTISSVGTCESNIVMSFTTDVATYADSGLSASTTYHYNVVVKDEAGNKTLYVDNSQATSAGSSGSGQGLRLNIRIR